MKRGNPARSLMRRREYSEAMTIDEAAEFLGISRGAAYRAIHAGDIPCIRIGRLLRVPKLALEAWMASPPPFNTSPAE